jgi:hypothetical protein
MFTDTHRRARPVAALAVLAAACATLPVQAASAAPAPAPAEHCVADLGSGAQKCFATFTRAVAAATGGRLTDAPASPRAAAGDDAFRDASRALARTADARAEGEVIQGTFFTDPGFSGSSLTIYGAAPCKKDGWVNYQYDFGDDWKNVISSVQPWADCWLWLYPEPNLGGDRDGPFDENTPDVGSFMNDRAQSVGFS